MSLTPERHRRGLALAVALVLAAGAAPAAEPQLLPPRYDPIVQLDPERDGLASCGISMDAYNDQGYRLLARLEHLAGAQAGVTAFHARLWVIEDAEVQTPVVLHYARLVTGGMDTSVLAPVTADIHGDFRAEARLGPDAAALFSHLLEHGGEVLLVTGDESGFQRFALKGPLPSQLGRILDGCAGELGAAQ